MRKRSSKPTLLAPITPPGHTLTPDTPLNARMQAIRGATIVGVSYTYLDGNLHDDVFVGLQLQRADGLRLTLVLLADDGCLGLGTFQVQRADA